MTEWVRTSAGPLAFRWAAVSPEAIGDKGFLPRISEANTQLLLERSMS